MKITQAIAMVAILAAGLVPGPALSDPGPSVAFHRSVPALGAGGGAEAQPSLSLTPTALQELDELRINTGEKAVLRDGTYSAVYEKRIPAPGNTYLNFHVDVASKAGKTVLLVEEIYLEADPAGGNAPNRPDPVRYTPFESFIDTGLEQVRGKALTVDVKGVLQFTIEVPRAGMEDLTLFVGAQRIGTVSAIRERIAIQLGAN